MLRLRDRDAETLDQITRATDAELALWESEGTGDLAGICAAVVHLRDADEDEAAERLIEHIALGHPVRDVMRLAHEFAAMYRFLDESMVERALAVRRKPIDLFRWLSGEGGKSETRSSLLKSIAVNAPVENIVRINKACVEHGSSELGFALHKAIIENGREIPEKSGDLWRVHLRGMLDANKRMEAKQS